MTQSYALTPHLDTSAAPPLATDLMDLRGRDLNIDASQTTFVGALGLQVLASASLQWAHDGHMFRISHASDALNEAAEGLGFPLATLSAASEGAE